jgi:hypothetical protein
MVREPILHPTPLAELRPTQITVGMREVAAKRREWRRKHGDKAGAFLAEHMIPVVLGPNERRYVIDHHHLARALHEEGVVSIATTLVANLSKLDRTAFWVFLDNRGWSTRSTTREGGAITTPFRNRSASWSTTPIARSPANCGAPAVLPRTRRRSASSCGPIFCAAASTARRSRRISTVLSRRR